MVDDEFSFDLSAAAWRRGITDEKAFVEALATRFERAFPDKTKVIRDHALFAKEHRVKRIEIAFEGTEFGLEFDTRHGITTSRAKVVRGIRLKTDAVPFPEWLASLSEEIRRFAAAHDELRAKLESFLMS